MSQGRLLFAALGHGGATKGFLELLQHVGHARHSAYNKEKQGKGLGKEAKISGHIEQQSYPLTSASLVAEFGTFVDSYVAFGHLTWRQPDFQKPRQKSLDQPQGLPFEKRVHLNRPFFS